MFHKPPSGQCPALSGQCLNYSSFFHRPPIRQSLVPADNVRLTFIHYFGCILHHLHATSTMMPCAPPDVAPLPVLRQNWEALA
jgi:hypothetical protein